MLILHPDPGRAEPLITEAGIVFTVDKGEPNAGQELFVCPTGERTLPASAAKASLAGVTPVMCAQPAQPLWGDTSAVCSASTAMGLAWLEYNSSGSRDAATFRI